MTDFDNFRSLLHGQHYLFQTTLEFISAYYLYTPCSFRNGPLQNPAGQNEGSCKLLGLALLEDLSLNETLLAFGEHYRSVLANPDGEDHGNIRALINSGHAGIHFDGVPLKRKA